ncbi:sn-glycerol-3-phosphate ABC transporter ATP-binding protein UgpC [Alphaproteobacteria bacterium]|nr:sn-glycerol-3-phosphate ABC transporter ATP-binding protein UgpC [Alphaproteobacteria bacterium]
MAEVQISKLTKRFGTTVAVQDFDLTIKNSEFVVFVGPSGCGKSTTLRMIAGLEEISSGDIAIDGMVVNNVHPKKRDIAMVFQNYALYPHLNVFDNISFGLRARKMSKAEIKSRTNEAAEILGLEDLLARRPGELSGGQKQRVAMGRAIVRKPKVFLFDEPLSNLDAKLRHKMRAEMKLLHQQVRTTTIYVTHDQVEAMTLADRIVIMCDGRVEQVGTPDEVYKKPASQFVAGFIGSPAMNFVAGTVEGSGTKKILKTDDGSMLAIPKCPAEAGQRLTLGFRPEHIVLDQVSARPKLALALSATSSVIEPMGHETIVTCAADFGEITIKITEEIKPTVGQSIPFHVSADKVHFFHGETGQRLD